MTVLNLILSLVVLGLMAAIVVKALPSGDGTGSKQVINELLEEVEDQHETPSNQTTPTASTSDGSQGSGGGSDGGIFGGVAGGPRGGIAGNADESACKTTIRTLATAIEAYQASSGALPGSWADFVNAGFLSEEPNLRGYVFTLDKVDGVPSGKVMVNGIEGEAGCATPAATGG